MNLCTTKTAHALQGAQGKTDQKLIQCENNQITKNYNRCNEVFSGLHNTVRNGKS